MGGVWRGKGGRKEGRGWERERKRGGSSQDCSSRPETKAKTPLTQSSKNY